MDENGMTKKMDENPFFKCSKWLKLRLEKSQKWTEFRRTKLYI